MEFIPDITRIMKTLGEVNDSDEFSIDAKKIVGSFLLAGIAFKAAPYMMEELSGTGYGDIAKGLTLGVIGYKAAPHLWKKTMETLGIIGDNWGNAKTHQKAILMGLGSMVVLPVPVAAFYFYTKRLGATSKNT